MNRQIQGGLLALQLVLLLWLGLAFTWWLGIAIFGGFLFLLIGFQFYLSRKMSGGKNANLSNQVAGNFMPQTMRLTTLQVCRAACQETVNCYRVFYFNQIFRVNAQWPDPSENPKTLKKIPVLLLHGFFCNRGIWVDFAAELADRGHWCEGITLEPPFGSISNYSQVIETAVEALITKTGANKIALVGHSMGGLAARSYLRDFGSAKIAKVITLGTPHQGTWFARLGHGVNAKEMGISSKWLDLLAQHEKQSGVSALFTTILTWYDNIVFPQGGQTIPGAKLLTVTGIGHVSMLFSNEVKDMVFKELKS